MCIVWEKARCMSKIILLAEDSLDDEIYFRRILKSAGIENTVHVVRDGAGVIAYLKGEGNFADRKAYPEPDILFLDLIMPGMDGWEVLKWLTAEMQRRTNLFVVVLSGSNQWNRLKDAYKMGAHSFMFKPLRKAELLGMVHYWPGPWMFNSPGSSPRGPVS